MVALAVNTSYIMELSLDPAPENRRISLIDRARTDPDAMAYLFRLHYDEIFQYCARRLFDRTAAEDVTSEIFMKMLQNLPTFRGNLRQFSAWLYKIASNEINSYLRSSARRKRILKMLSEQTSSDVLPDELVKAEDMTRVKQSMLSLKPKYQTVIALRYFHKMEYSEIANILGLRPATVRSQLARAVKKLRDIFNAKKADTQSRL